MNPMMLRHTIHVEFPALDRLVVFLSARQQAEIDAATAAVKAVTLKLKKSSDVLRQAVQDEQKT